MSRNVFFISSRFKSPYRCRKKIRILIFASKHDLAKRWTTHLWSSPWRPGPLLRAGPVSCVHTEQRTHTRKGKAVGRQGRDRADLAIIPPVPFCMAWLDLLPLLHRCWNALPGSLLHVLPPPSPSQLQTIGSFPVKKNVHEWEHRHWAEWALTSDGRHLDRGTTPTVATQLAASKWNISGGQPNAWAAGPGRPCALVVDG